MRILIAPDSFRGVLNAEGVALAIEEGLKRVIPECTPVRHPVADGGEGTMTMLVEHFNGETHTNVVQGLLGDPIEASWGTIHDGSTAVIEISAASGVETVPAERLNPLSSSSFGTGELIRAALDHGCTSIVLGLGGSGTIDGGLGVLQALGYRLLDDRGMLLKRGGGEMVKLAAIDTSAVDSRLGNVDITVLCDVDTPLFFEGSSVARMFGRQKGADADGVALLDAGLEQLVRVVADATGTDIGKGAYGGASGGVAATLEALQGAKLVSGIDTLLELTGLSTLLQTVDFVITGEGRIDRQTLRGKAPLGIIRAAKRYGKPVACITWRVAEDLDVEKLGCPTPIFELDDDGSSDHPRDQIAATATKLAESLLVRH